MKWTRQSSNYDTEHKPNTHFSYWKSKLSFNNHFIVYWLNLTNCREHHLSMLKYKHKRANVDYRAKQRVSFFIQIAFSYRLRSRVWYDDQWLYNIHKLSRHISEQFALYMDLDSGWGPWDQIDRQWLSTGRCQSNGRMLWFCFGKWSMNSAWFALIDW